MRRIRLVLAALAVVVAALAAYAGPAMAQTYSYDENWGNQQGGVWGPEGYYQSYDNGYYYGSDWDSYYGPYWGYYDPDYYYDPYGPDYYYGDGLYIGGDSDDDDVPDWVWYSY